ncbi:MAG: hypothetical protein AAFV53_14605 [Myxococcota bacterium]
MGWVSRLRGWFSEGSLPDEDSRQWMLTAWQWLWANDPLPAHLHSAPLIWPSAEDFPLTTPEDPERARQVFGMVKGHAGMAGWRCALQAQPVDVTAQLRDAGVYVDGGSGDPGGTFSVSAKGPLITYAPDFCEDLSVLIAVLAHEVGHLRLATVRAGRPGGPEMEEPLTDLCAIAMGFGIFLANTAVIERTHGDGLFKGWSLSTSGYLSARERAFALALFSETHRLDPQPIACHLDANPKRAYRSAVQHIRHHHGHRLPTMKSVSWNDL